MKTVKMKTEVSVNHDSDESNITDAEVCFTCFRRFQLILFLQIASMLPIRTTVKKSDKDPEHPQPRAAAQAAKGIITPSKRKKNARQQKGKRKAPEPSDINVPSPNTAKRLCASVKDIKYEDDRSCSVAAMLEPIQSAMNAVGPHCHRDAQCIDSCIL